MKILIYGGSFDPVHTGHTEVLKVAAQFLKIDLIKIIPTKVSGDKELEATPHQRLEMVKIVSKKIENCEVDDFEILKESNEPSYSINTIKYLKKQYPNDELFFLIGADQLKIFKTWKKWEEIIKLTKVVVYNRDFIFENEKFNIENVELLPFSCIYVSSTEIKNNLMKIDYLDPDVVQYIVENGLYAKYWLLNYMSQKRLGHSLRVAYMMEQTLNHNGYCDLAFKGFIAGLYHDISKELDDEKMIEIYKRENHKELPVEVLHGVVGSYFLKNTLKYNDQIVLNAISRHTLPFAFGEGELSIIDMCLYCCDKLESLRTNEDINNIEYFRSLLKIDIKKCFDELFLSLSKQYSN
ncbi:MAG: nicotinate (nicotinamide) nucleotide adenylyltransferase [Mycoplasma sp.]